MTPEIQQIILALQKNAKFPIELDEIIKAEGNIRVRPGDYGEKFDGRIEYIREKQIFILYHPNVITPRVRFSIAHELGHFYIPEHRNLLLGGEAHNSNSGFISDKRLEREADEFASHLLIPQSHLEKLLWQKSFLTIVDLLELAKKFQASVTAMAIRYVKMTSDPCAIILSKNGQQLFYWPSDEMNYRGFRWRGSRRIPPNTATSKAAENQGSGKVFENEKESDSSLWFSSRKKECDLWEEAFPLGYTGLVLTMLSDTSDINDKE
jgi:Zn-dependent peptidase ImmA (M78 family)